MSVRKMIFSTNFPWLYCHLAKKRTIGSNMLPECHVTCYCCPVSRRMWGSHKSNWYYLTLSRWRSLYQKYGFINCLFSVQYVLLQIYRIKDHRPPTHVTYVLLCPILKKLLGFVPLVVPTWERIRGWGCFKELL